ncbi:LAETG motif-containing sortase-dependent surface protein [Actinoplanes sp. NPDC020271]|uniref:LAETG motif-containing sortase-dependent surface protein n=1 Tax=Actinoplanes sp. NPDC020271 TaxID=3363896 RepID=UPI0037926169
MNLFKSPSRRAGTVVAGAALGLVGVLSSAVPALACHPKVNQDKTTACANADGSWVVNWNVGTTDNAFGDGTVKEVKYTPADQTISFTGIKAGDVISHYRGMQATQVLKAEATQATLDVVGKWKQYNGGWYWAGFEKGPVSIAKPSKLCDGQHTTPPSNTPPSNTPSSAPASSAPASSAPASSAPASSAPASSAPASSAPASSAPASSAPSSVPASSTASTPVENPTLTEPQLVYDTTCDTFTVGVVVPADNTEALTVKFTPSKGDAKSVTAKPGETKTVDFKASEGLTVTASAEGQEDMTIAYEKPADCDDDQLALTGSNSSTIAGGAVLVLLVGAGLFFMARRRKVRFTA